MPATDTYAQKPSVSASETAWCQRACAASSPASAITSPSRNTRMGCAAARAPALRARARPNPRRSWRTSFTSSGAETGRAGSSSGGSEPSSTTTTSSNARGQSCPSSPASVSASAPGASKQGTTTLTGSVGAKVAASGSRIRRQSL